MQSFGMGLRHLKPAICFGFNCTAISELETEVFFLQSLEKGQMETIGSQDLTNVFNPGVSDDDSVFS